MTRRHPGRQRDGEGSGNVTTWVNARLWKGKTVLWESEHDSCEHDEVEVMHHYDDDGRHYCPTGFLMCHRCGAVADEPEPSECTLWGVKE